MLMTQKKKKSLWVPFKSNPRIDRNVGDALRQG